MSRPLSDSTPDALIIGSGPNGLAAGITLARAGLSVRIYEARATIGGGTRTEELTLPGFHHDVCSAVHPMALVSPFLKSLPLAKFGLEWDHPEVLVAHPLENGAGALWRDLERTVEAMPGADGRAWRRLMKPLLDAADGLFADMLGPLPLPPKHPFALARFGLSAVRSARSLALGKFQSEAVRALFAGNAAHSVLPLEAPLTGAVGLALALAGHAGGWPVARGGSASITRAMARYFEGLGGEIVCGQEVTDLRELPRARAVLFDTGPRALARIAGDRLPDSYRRKLTAFRYGPAVYKVDLAVSAPVPWKQDVCRAAGTVHLGGPLDEVCESERACWKGGVAEKPFVLLAQQSVCDPTRAPAGAHTVWAYAHVPPEYDGDLTDVILDRIEGFAPGFRDTILATSVMRPADVARHNANNVGGDIVGGVMDARQLFTRPVARWNPHTTPDRALYLCSASTPPGGGVHGMCGWHSARTALRRVFGMS